MKILTILPIKKYAFIKTIQKYIDKKIKFR